MAARSSTLRSCTTSKFSTVSFSPPPPRACHPTATAHLHVAHLHRRGCCADPQTVTAEMGPTELCPGTHFGAVASGDPRRGSVAGPIAEPPADTPTVLTACPAGSVFITDYPILHRRAGSSVACTRNALKYNYWRTSPPERDWLGSAEPFDYHGTVSCRSSFAQADTARSLSQKDVGCCGQDWNGPYGGVMSSCVQVSRRFFWLSGEEYPKYAARSAPCKSGLRLARWFCPSKRKMIKRCTVHVAVVAGIWGVRRGHCRSPGPTPSTASGASCAPRYTPALSPSASKPCLSSQGWVCAA